MKNSRTFVQCLFKRALFNTNLNKQSPLETLTLGFVQRMFVQREKNDRKYLKTLLCSLFKRLPPTGGFVVEQSPCPGGCSVTCPGCQKKMEESALMGIWIRPDGRRSRTRPVRGAPASSPAQDQTARERLTARIEEVLTAAVEAKQEVVH